MGKKKKLFGWRSKINEYSLTLGQEFIIDLINWLTNLNLKQFMPWEIKRLPKILFLRKIV